MTSTDSLSVFLNFGIYNKLVSSNVNVPVFKEDTFTTCTTFYIFSLFVEKKILNVLHNQDDRIFGLMKIIEYLV